jgi:hypothetical protein
MIATDKERRDILQRMVDLYRSELDRVDRIDAYMDGRHARPYTPSTATAEYRLLAERSVTNWLPLVVDVMAQTLYVEGYRGTDPALDGSGPWERVWTPNSLDATQSALHRAALTYGRAYAVVLPAEGGGVAIRTFSPRRMVAAFAEPGDEVPVYALSVVPFLGRVRLSLYDDTHRYVFDAETLGDTDRAPLLSEGPHGAPWCPVVTFRDCPDLDGRSRGQVEPLISIQDRINQTTFDLLVAQTYGSFKVRTISGMAAPVDENGEPLSTIEVSIKRFLMAEDPDTRFGQLDETDLSGYLESLDLTVRHLAAISQTPPHALLGQMANLSAEALVAAEAGLTRKTDERRLVFGQAWEAVLQLGAAILGEPEELGGQVIWRDAEARSLSQTVDALGKAAQMLGIPVQALWERIPGVTLQDVERWRALAAEADPLAQLNAFLTSQEDAPEDSEATAVKAKADALGVLIRAGVSAESAAAQVGLPGVQFSGAVPSSLRLPAADAVPLEDTGGGGF